MGNAKSVDIIASTSKGEVKIDAKAGRAKGNWPIRKESIAEDMFYIFVHLKTEKHILNNEPPEFLIIPGKDINDNEMIETWGKAQGLRYNSANKNYRDRWDLLGERPK